MAEIESSADALDREREEPVRPRAPGRRASAAGPGRMRAAWDGLNEVVKSPVFVFFVGGSFIAFLPRLEEWRLPESERLARQQEQQTRADAAVVVPFLANLDASQPGKFRATKAALDALGSASKLAHDGKESPLFEGVNASVKAITDQLWPQPVTTTADIPAEPAPAAAPSPGSGGGYASRPTSPAAPPAPPANLAQTCVYIQVARNDAAKLQWAADLKSQLTARSSLVPAIQQMSEQVVPRQTQVRYFNAEDRGNALAVATVVSGITHTEVGVARPALQAKPGTLEVWFSK